MRHTAPGGAWRLSGGRLIAGVFVGGGSRRMGGRPKGWLLAPPSPEGARVSVLERTVALARERCDDVVLVGRAEAYAAWRLGVGVGVIDDATGARATGGGPLAGLVALLEYAAEGAAIALACDMPYVTREMLARLATFAPDAAAVAPRDAGNWSPFFARYDAARVGGLARTKLEEGERSLRAVLDAVDTRELPLSPDELPALRDWDAPEDIDAEASQ
ncbi:MAG: molybdenum cofactor guanylyltransferase [Polyangiaceae bacterium]